MSEDGRQHPRYPCELPCTLRVDGAEHGAQVKNVSVGGLFVEADLLMGENPPPFELHIPALADLPEVRVKVELAHWRYRDPEAGIGILLGYGVRVTRVNPHFLTLVRVLADEHEAKQAAEEADSA